MILIWKKPAMEILILSTLVAAVLREILPLGYEATTPIAVLLWGCMVFGGDVWFRRSHGLPMFDLRASTLFFILPTWLLGAVGLLAGTVVGISAVFG